MRSLPKVSDVAVAVAALLVAASVVRREFLTAPAVESSTEPREYIENWPGMLQQAILIGESEADLWILEFADLECPACRSFHETTIDLQREYGEELGVAFLHYPLPQHRFALPAARALECADVSGRGAAMIDVIYAKQDSLGLKTWSSFASDAGIEDVPAFADCVLAEEDPARIDAGIELGNMLGIRGTPTVIVNGWRIPFGSAFRKYVQRIRDGKAPYTSHAVRHLDVGKT